MKLINVREIEDRDIDPITDYWLFSDPDYLVGMGVDLNKLPAREDLRNMLEGQLAKPLKEKMSYALIWEIDGQAVGHCNVNKIEHGQSAYMHLHLWQNKFRQKGLGSALVKKSLPYFFDHLHLQKLYCEPYALNPAPNKTLAGLGFQFVKKHSTIPGSLNFEQEVNLWVLSRADYLK